MLLLAEIFTSSPQCTSFTILTIGSFFSNTSCTFHLDGPIDMEPPIDGTGTRSISTIKLPFSFEVESSSKNAYSFAITILQKLEAIDIYKLPDASFKEKHVFFVTEDVSSLILTLKCNYLYVKLQTQLTDKDFNMAIMFPVFGRCFGVIKVPKELKFRDLSLSSSQILANFQSSEEHINSWKITNMSNSQDEELDGDFYMKPPVKLYQKPDIKQEVTNEDPLNFLFSRYYSTLYSLNTPLSYFPKTALTRFKNLCSNDSGKIQEILQKLYIPLGELDRRHDGKYGILKLMENPKYALNEYEKARQDEFIRKYESLLEKLGNDSEKEMSTTEKKNSEGKEKKSHLDKFSTMVIELKVREAQMQVLITLELLMLLELPEAQFIEDCQKKQEKELEKQRKQNMRSLVRKKKAKRKIVPTFLGIGLGVSETSLQSEGPTLESVDGYTLFESLNSLSDRMSIWDTLLGKSLSDKDDSSFGFLAYVLVPFCNRKLPLTVKYIINKFKSLNPKMVNPKRSSSGQRSGGGSRKSSTSESSPDALPEDTTQHKRSKYRKLLIGPENVPLRNKTVSLKRSNTSLTDKNDLLPAFSLKRSRPTLSARNTERRQIDMGVKPTDNSDKTIKNSDKNSAKPKLQSVSEVKPGSKLSIFGDARRIKTMEPLSQVQATPAKKKKDTETEVPFVSVMETPARKQILSENKLEAKFETPAKRQILEKSAKPVIFQTPANEPSILDIPHPQSTFIIPDSIKRSSVSNKLLQESLKSETDVVSSPEEGAPESIYSSPIREKSTPVGTHSTPGLNSSETRKRRRPGEPVSVLESPFFNSTLSGSPFISKGKVSKLKKSKKVIKKQKEPVVENASDLQSPTQLQIPEALQSPEQVKAPRILLSPTQNVATDNDNDNFSDDSDIEILKHSTLARPSRVYGRAKALPRFR